MGVSTLQRNGRGPIHFVLEVRKRERRSTAGRKLIVVDVEDPEMALPELGTLCRMD